MAIGGGRLFALCRTPATTTAALSGKASGATIVSIVRQVASSSCTLVAVGKMCLQHAMPQQLATVL